MSSWRDWVREAQSHHKGWAHRWTSLKEHWRPVKVLASGRLTGRPRYTLQSEKERLTSAGGYSEEQEEWFQAGVSSYSGLPEVAIEEFLRAARSFPRRTASTWDGFHPRHYCMLTEKQAGVVIELPRLAERVSVLPTVPQTIFAKLIPKLMADATEFSHRSI